MKILCRPKGSAGFVSPESGSWVNHAVRIYQVDGYWATESGYTNPHVRPYSTCENIYLVRHVAFGLAIMHHPLKAQGTGRWATYLVLHGSRPASGLLATTLSHDLDGGTQPGTLQGRDIDRYLAVAFPTPFPISSSRKLHPISSVGRKKTAVRCHPIPERFVLPIICYQYSIILTNVLQNCPFAFPGQRSYRYLCRQSSQVVNYGIRGLGGGGMKGRDGGICFCFCGFSSPDPPRHSPPSRPQKISMSHHHHHHHHHPWAHGASCRVKRKKS